MIEIQQDSDTIDCLETDPKKRCAIAESWRVFMRAYLARVFDVPDSSVTVEIGPGMCSNVWVSTDLPRGAGHGESVVEHVEKHGYDAWLKSL